VAIHPDPWLSSHLSVPAQNRPTSLNTSIFAMIAENGFFHYVLYNWWSSRVDIWRIIRVSSGWFMDWHILILIFTYFFSTTRIWGNLWLNVLADND
jgi:hypothetical protein